MNNNSNNPSSSNLSDQKPVVFSDMEKQPVTKALTGHSGGGTAVMFSSMSNPINSLYSSAGVKNSNATQISSMPYKTMNILQVSNNEPLSKAPDMMLESKANYNSDMFVQSKVSLSGLRSTPAVFNEYNSFVVSDSPLDVFQTCVKVLTNFEFDVVLQSVDDQNFIIGGNAFVTNMGVNFKICIFRETGGTRIEITRSAGDSLSYSNFYGCMEQSLAKCLKVVGNTNYLDSSLMNQFAFPSLPSLSMESLEMLDFSDMDMNMAYTEDDLNRFAQDLNEDSYQLETLEEVYGLDKQTIVGHGLLIDAVGNCCKSTDVAVQRLALKIMSKVEITVTNVNSQFEVIQKYINKK